MGKLDDLMGLINRRKEANRESDHKKCDTCYVCVNNYANFMCVSCLTNYDKKSMIGAIKNQFGEFWEERYKYLLKLQKRVRSGKIKGWPTRYSRINHRGDEIIWEFYE